MFDSLKLFDWLWNHWFFHQMACREVYLDRDKGSQSLSPNWKYAVKLLMNCYSNMTRYTFHLTFVQCLMLKIPTVQSQLLHCHHLISARLNRLNLIPSFIMAGLPECISFWDVSLRIIFYFLLKVYVVKTWRCLKLSSLFFYYLKRFDVKWVCSGLFLLLSYKSVITLVQVLFQQFNRMLKWSAVKITAAYYITITRNMFTSTNGIELNFSLSCRRKQQFMFQSLSILSSSCPRQSFN